MLTMKTLWFKRKLYGWGWTPCTWQGWAIIAIYIVNIVFIFRTVDSVSHSGSDTLIGVFIPFVILTIFLLIICYKTGEKPRWQWGKRLD